MNDASPEVVEFAQAILEQRDLKREPPERARIVIEFAKAGLVSGGITAFSCSVIYPLVLGLPGITLGIALSYAVGRTLLPLSNRNMVLLVLSSALSYVLSVGFTMWFPALLMPFTTSMRGDLWLGISGAFGGFLLAIAVVTLVPCRRKRLCVVVVSLVGAISTMSYLMFAIVLRDLAGGQLPVVLMFAVWQTAVAATFGYFGSTEKWISLPGTLTASSVPDRSEGSRRSLFS
ncbi:hypothetical protein [Planctomicrobium piriforme]|uniref:Uncharacterized protein n=1 Tax=Planctomicrobium piriforme TaxID=1576369 RepID=A0A1I3DF50_9PLAN|nr:hypothetical protein [Planctomicrobium piriforme]SFH85188.1 hypothetical protein SAMN05421753_103207 [Planctomicrobium piriforme]